MAAPFQHLQRSDAEEVCYWSICLAMNRLYCFAVSVRGSDIGGLYLFTFHDLHMASHLSGAYMSSGPSLFMQVLELTPMLGALGMTPSDC